MGCFEVVSESQDLTQLADRLVDTISITIQMAQMETIPTTTGAGPTAASCLSTSNAFRTLVALLFPSPQPLGIIEGIREVVRRASVGPACRAVTVLPLWESWALPAVALHPLSDPNGTEGLSRSKVYSPRETRNCRSLFLTSTTTTTTTTHKRRSTRGHTCRRGIHGWLSR